MTDAPSPTAHARQMLGIRMRAEHAAQATKSGRTISDYTAE